MGKALKVGIVMGGGVSLGAFSAGALAEILRQLSENARPDFRTVEVDVLSGSSAGGLTLALLLRALADPEAGAIDERLGKLRGAWVEDIDLDQLLPPRGVRPGAVLDRRGVERLAHKHLDWPSGRAPSRTLLADRLLVGFTLLNYNGIPLEATRDPALGDALATTLYRDFRWFCLEFAPSPKSPPPRAVHYQHMDRSEPWQDILTTAVACGAFPLAFEPVRFKREPAEYEGLWRGVPAALTFADGGTFNNEPLREAMEMARLQDESHPAHDFERVLIYIDPYLSGSGFKAELGFGSALGAAADSPTPPGRELALTAGRLAQVVLGQAAFKDVLAAVKINHRLEWREGLRTLLRLLLAELGPDRVEALGREVERELGRILSRKAKVALTPTYPEADSHPQDAIEQELRRVCREDGGSWENVSASNRLFFALGALIDQVAALNRRQNVPVIAVAPRLAVSRGELLEAPLAGDFYLNFGGFFDRRFREHDFAAGEAMARWALGTQGRSLLKSAPALPDLGGLKPEPRPASAPTEALRSFASRVGAVSGEVVRDNLRLPLVSALLGWLTRVLVKRGVYRRARAEARS
jgi:predicted acylesterase/phospholipase RssA